MKKYFLAFVAVSFSLGASAQSDLQYNHQIGGGGNVWSLGNGFMQLAYNFITNPLVAMLLGVAILIWVIKKGSALVKYGYHSTNDKYGYHKQFHAGGGGDKPKEEKKA
jgi:hypothetical protein